MQGCREKISIIIPIYNVAPWLERCLQSVRTQTFQSLEILAVNDGSTDSCAAILEQFAKQEPRLKIITQQNQGPSAARRAGAIAATGDFVLFLDGDDFLEPDYCQQLFVMWQRTGADLVVAPLERFSEGKELINKQPLPLLFAEAHVLSAAQKNLVFTDFSASMALCGKLLTRSLAAQIDWALSPYKTGDDIFPALQAIALARQIAVQPSAVYHYRVNRTGSQSTASPNRFKGLFEGFLRARKFLEKTGNYSLLAPGFEYVRRVCLLSFIEKYGLTKEEEKLVMTHRAELYVPNGIFQTRPLKFRLRQKLFDCCLRFNLSYEVLSRLARKLSCRI